jgi:vancomycin resistance protein VanJ
MKKWLTRGLVVAAVLYPVVLAGIVVLFSMVGERWWVSDVGLFLPRLGFLAPILLFVPLLWLAGLRPLLWTQVAALAIGLFPLMGLTLRWPSTDEQAPKIRVFSYNVNSGGLGVDRIIAAIEAAAPDVVLLQEAFANSEPIGKALEARYATVQRSTQFIIASRFPIVETLDPDRIHQGERERSPRFMRHVLATPLGRVIVYNVHPVSPRFGFYQIRGQGLRREMLSGRLFAAANVALLNADSQLRAEQIKAFSALADADTDPVIIAGDTNTPGGSRVLYAYLARYQDGFAQAGRGFGYTYPTRLPWMRIDRIFASQELRFVSFTVDCGNVSDHQCVFADLQRSKL